MIIFQMYFFFFFDSDGLAHSARRLLEQHRIDLLRNITDLLGRTFPSQFVFPVLGHEDGHGNSFDRLGDLWRHWLPSEALQTFEKGKSFFILKFYWNLRPKKNLCHLCNRWLLHN